MGFSIVPHVWLPEKIVTDCHTCPLFRRCGQYAVVRATRTRTRAAVAPWLSDRRTEPRSLVHERRGRRRDGGAGFIAGRVHCGIKASPRRSI